VYEVYALTLAEGSTPACQFLYREPSHDPITLHSTAGCSWWASSILVDTGFREEDARARGLQHYVQPAAALERLGVKPADVGTC